MCHRHYIAEEEPLRERFEEAEPEFGREPEEAEPELDADEPEVEEEKPAVPTPSDD